MPNGPIMKLKTIKWLGLLAILLLILQGCQFQNNEPEELPNILWITSEDNSAYFLGYSFLISLFLHTALLLLFYCGFLATELQGFFQKPFTEFARNRPPPFVTLAVVSLFLLDLCFPICFYLQWKQIGAFRDYMVGEAGFIALSFTAKTFLAWVTLAGANAYTRY